MLSHIYTYTYMYNIGIYRSYIRHTYLNMCTGTFTSLVFPPEIGCELCFLLLYEGARSTTRNVSPDEDVLFSSFLCFWFSTIPPREDETRHGYRNGNRNRKPKVQGLFSNATFDKRPETIIQDSDFHFR